MLAEISFYNVVLFVLADMAERDIAASADQAAVRFGRDYERLFAQVRGATLAMNALILIAIFLMVTKPGA